jgi:hypothetical protein
VENAEYLFVTKRIFIEGCAHVVADENITHIWVYKHARKEMLLIGVLTQKIHATIS